MSQTKLVEWIKHLLFGGGYVSAPFEIQNLIQKLNSKGIDIEEVMKSDGLTMKSYDIAGDLEKLLDYFDKEPEDYPVFKTRHIASIFNQLLVILKRPQKNETWQLPDLTKTDSDILKSILENKAENENLPYQDVNFWGKIAFRLLNHRRPPSDLIPLKQPSAKYLQNIIRLYDVTCKTIGIIIDPFDMVLVPRHEYVDPVFLTDLKVYLQLYPDHSLFKSIRRLLDEIVELFLDAKVPSFFHNERLQTFMNNVSIVHEEIRKVEDEKIPPKLIDIFQRLLALSSKDYLWHTELLQNTHKSEKDNELSLHLYRLHEKIYYLEKQNRLLLNSLTNLTT
ncbi:hypothetical protein AVEN_167041-1 [Araneus ventricosus]|uniref:Uncharacterized protein n=1 Tax=Araneus ventricosus TaxID=182803 RepID=A0A4Y2SM29_ARAVE|nr:hypothetical protein AVEN_167041-1 [Araneus ventricosus]